MDSQELSQAMRAAMRRLGSTVSIVTARRGPQRYAMTATAITSLTMDPPALLVCVNRGAAIHPILNEASEFVVNILAAEQQDVAAACGGQVQGEARFELGEWAETEGRIPYLLAAQANLLCEPDGRFDYGTHTVFIGRIKKIETREEVNPLGYLNGGYIATQMPQEPREPGQPARAIPI